MPFFVLHCLDKPDSLPLRMATRDAHLAYLGGRRDEIRIAGPMLHENGDMAGTLLILDVPDQAAAEAFSADDPYTKAGLWDRVSINGVRATLGQF